MKTIFEMFGGAYRQAGETFERLVRQIKREDGLNEQLKATDTLEWVRRMNNIHNRAEEIVYKELICV